MTSPDADLYLHIRVLISMILGLSVTRLVSGVASFIQHPGRDRIWPLHLAWVAWALLNVAAFWWWEFWLAAVPDWTFGLYAFVLVYAGAYVLLSALLFPGDLHGYVDFQDYFLDRRAWFFGVLAATRLLDVVDSLIKGEAHLRALGDGYYLRVAVFLALCLLGARTRNLKLHLVLALFALVYDAVWFSLAYGQIA